MVDDDSAPKSAVELAMEKLRAEGFEEKRLTDEQKAEIAEIRSRYRAKIAELEIHQEGKLRAATSFDELEALKTEMKTEKKRLEEEMEKKVTEVRDQ